MQLYLYKKQLNELVRSTYKTSSEKKVEEQLLLWELMLIVQPEMKLGFGVIVKKNSSSL